VFAITKTDIEPEAHESHLLWCAKRRGKIMAKQTDKNDSIIRAPQIQCMHCCCLEARGDNCWPSRNKINSVASYRRSVLDVCPCTRKETIGTEIVDEENCHPTYLVGDCALHITWASNREATASLVMTHY